MIDTAANRQARVLAFDTSGPSLSVAIADDNGNLLGESLLNVSNKHSIHFMPALDALMRQTETVLDQLCAIAVTRGPGSFTGIRIGVTTANTMAFGLQIPVIGVSSLAALAEPYHAFDGWVLPAFDARGGRVFAAFFANGKRLSEDAQQVDDQLAETFRQLSQAHKRKAMPPKILILGNGAATVTRLLAAEHVVLIRPTDFVDHNLARDSSSPIGQAADLIRASSVLALAGRQLTLTNGDRIEEVSPNYCVVSQAERMRRVRQG